MSIFYHATLRNEDILEMLPHLLFLVDANPVVLNMPVHVLTQGHNDRCCCLSSRLAPMSYSVSHHLCNCSLTSTIYWLPVGTHVSGTDPCFDLEEQLASAIADFGQALAKMKCPSNYLSGLTKYVPTSSIIPIPAVINGYVLYCQCIKHLVVNMPNMF